MRLAVVGWAADSGVGRELVDAVRHLPVSCAFILENPAKKTRKDLLLGTPSYFSNPSNLDKQMEFFLECHRPDTVLTWEVPGNWTFPAIWTRMGLKWIHMVHWDWFSTIDAHMSMWKTAYLLSPNRICQKNLKETCGFDSVLLPVPIDTDQILFKERKRADLFISVYGYGGLKDRRSIPEILEAWRKISRPPQLVIKAQQPPEELKGVLLPAGVSIQVGNTPEPADLYANGDVALQPSRYEGVGVSMLEAQAAGLPVIAVDAPPMNEIVCGPRVSIAKTVQIQIMSKALPSYIPSVKGIVNAVSNLKGKDISELSRQARTWVEGKFSWKALKGNWIETLSTG